MKQSRLFSEEPTPWLDAEGDDVLCAKVAFNLPLNEAYDYLIPLGLRGRLGVGQRVQVPFGKGNRLMTGYCVGVERPVRSDGLKQVQALIDPDPLLTPQMLDLTRWIAERYFCGWGQVLESVVPAGVKKQAGTREVLVLRINPQHPELPAEVKLPAKQAAVWDALHKAGRPLSIEELSAAATCGTGPINALRHKRLIEAITVRSNFAPPPAVPALPGELDLKLNADQQRVLNPILAALRERQHRTFLLHGVTGSGKTEVYIRAIKEVVSYGRQAIVLVPEISLTPQTIRRFRNRFPSVSVLHSHLTDVERNQHWQQIASGEVQVIVGARSAVFAPTPHLGLIVIDEEHENSFKQDQVPRYHAREVARKRAELEGVPLLLGSATPTLESWRRACEGTDVLLSLPKRVEGLPMPPVHIVDVREDAFIQGGSAIGRALKHAMDEALSEQGQVILFLNLRGYSPVLWCKRCGASVKCAHCDISLNWHKEDKLMKCHLCNAQGPPPTACPSCELPGLRFLGIGTQRLEHEVRSRFPKAKCIRMDSDSMRQRGSHDVALEAFRKGDYEILLGTQMISKGLDFPNVTLVGVIDADTMLHQPDMRASERTFQLIAQVAGRTGRSRRGGKVLVQTSSPTEPAIVLAAKHDYLSFARNELHHRRQMLAPPFQSFVRVILRGPDEDHVNSAALKMVELFRQTISAGRLPVRLLGPAPCPVTKVQANFRYHFQFASDELPALQQLWKTVQPLLAVPKEVEYTIDVDPLNMR